MFPINRLIQYKEYNRFKTKKAMLFLRSNNSNTLTKTNFNNKRHRLKTNNIKTNWFLNPYLKTKFHSSYL
jgi:hypothetical protein